MAKVRYAQGTKEQYLGIETKLDTCLYWCTDTRELFKGEDLYSDGVRLAKTFAGLPSLNKAADGVLYFCTESNTGYVLNGLRSAWIQVIYPPDGDTIIFNEEGQLAVHRVPMESVTGLTERLSSIDDAVEENALRWETF